MRIGSGQLPHSIRTAVLVAACVALVAMTSGLLLAIHILNTEHSATHDSHDCTVCQQLLASSKKVLPAPGVELVQQTPIPCADVPESVQHVEHRHLQVSRPRTPLLVLNTSLSERLLTRRRRGEFIHAFGVSTSLICRTSK